MVRGACRQAKTKVIAFLESSERGSKKTGKEKERRKAKGHKWPRTTGDHSNDLWLIAVTDRHAAWKSRDIHYPDHIWTTHTHPEVLDMCLCVCIKPGNPPSSRLLCC